MKVKQISIFLENNAGKLAEVVNTLSGCGINLRAMSLAETQDFGIVRIIADDPYKASNTLKEAGYVFSVKDVIAVALEDKAGSLASVLSVLGENGINMEYMYAFTTPASGAASLIIRATDDEKAIEVLKKNNIRLIMQSDLG